MHIRSTEVQHHDQQRSGSIHRSGLRVKSARRRSSQFGRIGLAIDTQNILSCALERGIAKIDYWQLLADIIGSTPWFGVACVALPVSGKPVDGFLAYLERLGLRVAVWESPMTAGRLKVDLDTLLVREATAMLYTQRMTDFCVVGGDVDYNVLADVCHSRRVRFGVAAFDGCISPTLREGASWIFQLGDRHAAAWVDEPTS
jgi:hypothetical protein